MQTPSRLVASVVALLITVCASAAATTIKFSGYDWTVKSGTALDPGPNNWDANNVWVDQRGFLHLTLTQRGGQWYCSQVSMHERLGFGWYQFWVLGRVDQLDPNVVFGLFTYPPPDVGPDGTHEMDIEFAQWGKAAAPRGNYTVWPARQGLNRAFKRFAVNLSGAATTHRWLWTATSVTFQSLPGHVDDHTHPFAAWRYQPRDPTQYIGAKPMPVQINLWLFKGQPPRNGQQVELIVQAFTFTPR